MPEPNLPPLHLHVNEKSDNKFNLISAVSLKLQLPKMPNEIRKTMTEQYQIPLKTTLQIMVIIFTNYNIKLYLIFSS